MMGSGESGILEPNDTRTVRGLKCPTEWRGSRFQSANDIHGNMVFMAVTRGVKTCVM